MRRTVRPRPRAFDDQFVVDLKDELARKPLGLHAVMDVHHCKLDDVRRRALDRVFRATRSPKERMLKFADFSSGRGRLRPNRVVT